MAPRSETRSKMVKTAARLFQRQGYGATGWRQVVAESDTPWGSQSHHFPGGKEQLAVDALERSGAGYERLLQAAFVDGDPVAAIRAWTDAAAAQLEATDWAEGCPVATIALEQAHESDAIGLACDAAFSSWRDAITGAFEQAGIAPERAAPMATTVLAAIEGAMLLTRTQRSAEPLHQVGDELSTWVAGALRSTP